MIKKTLLILIALFLIADTGKAGEVSLSVSAPNTVTVGQRFRVTFTANASPERFDAPSFDGFRLLSGPSQSSSTSTQIINNQVTTSISISYTYLLEALSEGSYQIEPAGVRVDGNNYLSEPFNIRVLAASDPAAPASPSQPHQEHQEPGRPEDDDIFVRVTVSNQNPYQGEQVIVSYRLYTRLPVTNYSIERLPGFQGLWSENITPRTQPAVTTEVINGVNYSVAEIRRMVVFPQRSGEIRIEPMEVGMAVRMRAPARQRPGSLFDDFFGGSPFDRFQTITHAVRSNAVSLQVKPLPTQNRPGSFKGMVGRYSMDVSLSPEELDINDAANLVITISGEGNLRMLEPPVIQMPQHLEVFDPQISDNITVNRSGISGGRTFDYLIIPRSSGEAEISVIRFSYFDPQNSRYNTLTAGPFTLQIVGEQDIAAGSTTLSDGRLLADDIRFIYTGAVNWQPVGKMFYKSPLFYVLLLAPLILLLVFLGFWRHYKRMQQDVTAIRTRKARKMAVKRLKNAALLLNKHNKEAFFDEIFRALWGYVSDKLSIPVSRLNKENVAGAFASRGVSAELASRFLEGLEECEFARFSPGGMDSPMEKTYNKALETLVTLEKELRNQGIRKK
ncbi:MAG: protein BatD [Bacteroidia bacterium]|nr:MAG: protein BatD [Bacteroidia bacterium]